MRRNEDAIKNHVKNFFQEKDIDCGVDISERLVIKVEIADNEKSHTFKFPNNFNDCGEDWFSLDKLLESEMNIWRCK